MFGIIEVDAENTEDAKELLDDELFGRSYDGLDYKIEEM